MANPIFEELAAAMAEGDITTSLALFEANATGGERFHELFEVRKMQLRHRLGLPLLSVSAPVSALGADDTDSRQQQQLEQGLLDACREIGHLFLSNGKVRDAWVYLRAVSGRDDLVKRLEQLSPEGEQVDEMIDVAFGEGVAPDLGYRLMLEHYGTCNSITALSGQFPSLSSDARQSTVELLVRHIYRELRENLVAHGQKEKGHVAANGTIREWLDRRPELVADGNCHIDVSHLSATVGFARILVDRPSLVLAWELSDYGRRLDSETCFPGEEPFVDQFGSHALFFAGLLGHDREIALAHFRDRAHSVDAHQVGTLAVEIYVDLLSRCGQVDEAIRQSVKLIPPGTHTTGTAPSLLELSRKANRFDDYLRFARRDEDLLGFVAGLICQHGEDHGGSGCPQKK